MENDTLIIGSEKVKVLNIDPLNSRIRILRAFNDTVGSTHTIGKYLYEIPRKLKKNNDSKDYSYSPNKQIYFDPAESVGLGTTAGVGIERQFLFKPRCWCNLSFHSNQSNLSSRTQFKNWRSSNVFYGIGTVKGSGIIVQDETMLELEQLLQMDQVCLLQKSMTI